MSLPILYLAGPMTGYADFNHPAFNQAAKQLRKAGYEVVNPAENGLDRDAPWINHMRRDIILMMQSAEAVATLPLYESSRGALVETALAHRLGWRVLAVEMWLEKAKKTAEAVG